MAIALAAVAMLLPVAAASGATAPGYEEFADCPDRSVDPGIPYCTNLVVSSGFLQMGSKTVPITDPISVVTSTGGSGQYLVGSFDGGRQQVPGGIIGITGLDWLSWLFPFNLLTLHGEPELAGPITNEAGGALGLPLKIHLDSPILNDNCYIGSNANPIRLKLTSGTTAPPPPNVPISGQAGTLAPDPTLPGVIRSTGIKLVDNEFAVPAATGCDLLGLGAITALVNLQAGLPAAAGRNSTVQNAKAGLGSITSIFPPAGVE
jgi:hypothetical protein